MDLGGGIRTNGHYDPTRTLPRLKLPKRLDGRTVLDVGAWDGFYSFEMERRGAAKVLATDHFCWGGNGWATQDGFNLAREALGSKVEDEHLDVLDLSPEAVGGTYDIVLFLGVLYHLPEPAAGPASGCARWSAGCSCSRPRSTCCSPSARPPRSSPAPSSTTTRRTGGRPTSRPSSGCSRRRGSAGPRWSGSGRRRCAWPAGAASWRGHRLPPIKTFQQDRFVFHACDPAAARSTARNPRQFAQVGLVDWGHVSVVVSSAAIAPPGPSG